MIILVIGDRHYDSPRPIWAMLQGLWEEDSIGFGSLSWEPFVVIEGGQKKLIPGTSDYTGADYHAAQWAKNCHLHGPYLTPEQWKTHDEPTHPGISFKAWGAIYGNLIQPVVHHSHPADWNKYGKVAGPIRNSEMLKLHPDIDLVLAFHDDLSESKGTRDMVHKAQKAGIEVWVTSRRLPRITLL